MTRLSDQVKFLWGSHIKSKNASKIPSSSLIVFPPCFPRFNFNIGER